MLVLTRPTHLTRLSSSFAPLHDHYSLARMFYCHPVAYPPIYPHVTLELPTPRFLMY
ncbi:hypothetical protein FA13DRAFT_1457575 [Coprinellus micaceus]|uniref:Uncharacterized protein n=1 Tax=Coprinellus micaceus TaxID=71717 RepID=A0A4Y7SMH5_COPMI|nr:hypothetical protein FA13DRAFT_1457575 [Coprinellus micaceus]